MNVDEFTNIIYAKDAETGIVTVTINRPEIRNALTLVVLLELYWAVDNIENDDTVTAMIITGAKTPDSDDPTGEASAVADISIWRILNHWMKKQRVKST